MNEKTKATNEIDDNAKVTAAEAPVEKSEDLSPEEQEEVAGGRAGGDKLKYL